LTLRELLKHTERQLRRARLHYGHGTRNAREEAAYLVFGALSLPFDEPTCRRVSAIQGKRVERLVHRRIVERLPAAYLVRKAWLGDLELYVDRRVIVPRSFIAELLHERLHPWLRKPVRRVLDLCTGSGCLAILAARAFPQARVDAIDISASALAVAMINIERHRLRNRVRLMRSDLFDSVGRRRYDLIVANPPYVRGSSMRRLPAEYAHEPALALSGGESGLQIVSRILAAARGYLTEGGLLVCEIGRNQSALERQYRGAPFLWPETSAGPGRVFILEREQLGSPPRARTAESVRNRATRAAAPR
jgi:ribosomal protein L3 glutamine methyltransferase